MSQPTETIITIRVLTNEPVVGGEGDGDFALPDIEYLVTEGPGVGAWEITSVRTLTEAEMRIALVEAGNDGTFFDEEWAEEQE
jgi:hypothetical protein